MSLKKRYHKPGKLSPQPVRPAEAAKEKKAAWSSEKIISSSAILISLMSLFALFYQTNIMREEQELQRRAQLKSTMPYLMIANSNYGGPNYSIILSNKGIGPAIIDSTTIFYEDSVYQMDIPTFLYQEVPELSKLNNIYHSNIIPGQLISPGESIEIFKVDNAQESADQFLELLSLYNFDYRLVYRSVYDERWALTSERFFPVKLEEK